MLWALRANDPHNWLEPAQGDLNDVLALIAECDSALKYRLDRYKYPQRYDNVVANDYSDQDAQWLMGLDERLKAGSFLFCRQPCLDDMALVPFVWRVAHAAIIR